MSIRLKKVEWNYSGDGTLWRCVIAGWWYECWQPESGPARWGAAGTNGRVFEADTLDSAKAACEQHALERIREAVEVVSEHIPDATKMMNSQAILDGSNSPEIPDGWQPVETAPELEQVLIAYRGVNPNKPLIDVAFYHPDARSWDVCGHVRVNPVRVFAWMPLPEPPKEGG